MSSNKNDMLIKETTESMVLGQNAEKNMWPTPISLLMIDRQPRHFRTTALFLLMSDNIYPSKPLYMPNDNLCH